MRINLFADSIPRSRIDSAAIALGYKLAFPENAKELDDWLLGEDEYREW